MSQPPPSLCVSRNGSKLRATLSCGMWVATCAWTATVHALGGWQWRCAAPTSTSSGSSLSTSNSRERQCPHHHLLHHHLLLSSPEPHRLEPPSNNYGQMDGQTEAPGGATTHRGKDMKLQTKWDDDAFHSTIYLSVSSLVLLFGKWMFFFLMQVKWN